MISAANLQQVVLGLFYVGAKPFSVGFFSPQDKKYP